jgi:hypothetical protein
MAEESLDGLCVYVATDVDPLRVIDPSMRGATSRARATAIDAGEITVA